MNKQNIEWYLDNHKYLKTYNSVIRIKYKNSYNKLYEIWTCFLSIHIKEDRLYIDSYKTNELIYSNLTIPIEWIINFW